MKLRLAGDQTAKLVAALKRGGRREIGGQLFGEQLAPSNFVVTELAVQARPGTVARFVVGSLYGDDLVVSIGILRDPSANLLETAGVEAYRALSAYLPVPLVSGRAAQASASAVKRAVDAAAARLRPKAIRLFMAGPAAFAVALGHRWNAMPPTQLHEFLTGERRYVPTARL